MDDLFDDDDDEYGHGPTPGDQESEFLRYLRDPITPGEKGRSILETWALIAPSYPVVSKMARDILAVPCSAVGVERMFNSGRDVCTYRRGNLLSESVKEIMLVKHDYRRQETERIAREKAKEEDTYKEELRARVAEILTPDELACLDAAWLADREPLGSAEDELARQCKIEVPVREPEQRRALETRKRTRRAERKQEQVRRSSRLQAMALD